MIIFKRKRNENTRDLQYFAHNQQGQIIAKIKMCGMGWEVFEGDGPMTQSGLMGTFVRLADAKHFITQGFSCQDMQRDILGLWKRKEEKVQC